MKTKFILAVSLLAFALVVPNLSAQEKKARAKGGSAVTQALAVMHPTKGSKTKGTVQFTQDGRAVKVKAVIEGLNPNQKHAIHIHEFGDTSAEDGMATGGHYNPEGHQHGLTDKEMRHAGDLGNLQADAAGKATYEITVNNVTISGRNAILGRAVIIHAKEDDGGQPVGNAGARIAQGTIGVAKPAQ
ncbi:MAG: superoxide dismutase family protein [Verrucomicrobiota bacterium]